jgi:hypothetical protein
MNSSRSIIHRHHQQNRATHQGVREVERLIQQEAQRHAGRFVAAAGERSAPAARAAPAATHALQHCGHILADGFSCGRCCLGREVVQPRSRTRAARDHGCEQLATAG